MSRIREHITIESEELKIDLVVRHYSPEIREAVQHLAWVTGAAASGYNTVCRQYAPDARNDFERLCEAFGVDPRAFDEQIGEQT